LKYGIRIAFTHETKPKIKNNIPIMKIEITASRFVKELTLGLAEIVLPVIFIYIVIFVGRSAEENLSRNKVQWECHWRILAG